MKNIVIEGLDSYVQSRTRQQYFLVSDVENM